MTNTISTNKKHRKQYLWYGLFQRGTHDFRNFCRLADISNASDPLGRFQFVHTMIGCPVRIIRTGVVLATGWRRIQGWFVRRWVVFILRIWAEICVLQQQKFTILAHKKITKLVSPKIHYLEFNLQLLGSRSARTIRMVSSSASRGAFWNAEGLRLRSHRFFGFASVLLGFDWGQKLTAQKLQFWGIRAQRYEFARLGAGFILAAKC